MILQLFLRATACTKKKVKMLHVLQVLGVNEDLWDGVCGLGSET